MCIGKKFKPEISNPSFGSHFAFYSYSYPVRPKKGMENSLYLQAIENKIRPGLSTPPLPPTGNDAPSLFIAIKDNFKILAALGDKRR